MSLTFKKKLNKHPFLKQNVNSTDWISAKRVKATKFWNRLLIKSYFSRVVYFRSKSIPLSFYEKLEILSIFRILRERQHFPQILPVVLFILKQFLGTTWMGLNQRCKSCNNSKWVTVRACRRENLGGTYSYCLQDFFRAYAYKLI